MAGVRRSKAKENRKELGACYNSGNRSVGLACSLAVRPSYGTDGIYVPCRPPRSPEN